MSNLNEYHLGSALNKKLRLKKIDMSSKSISPKKVATHPIESKEESTMQEKTCNDDSLAHFKTPKRDVFTRSRIQKIKPIAMTNTKAQSMKRHKSRNTNKQIPEKKQSSNSGQTLIESSFFKTKELSASEDVQDREKLGHMCPLCFKILKNAHAQALHMKTCAAKNNISTKKLFEAKELQERQAAERASLGLPSAPVLQDKKKSVPRRTNLDENSDFELALALSKSLHEHADIWDQKDPAQHTSRIVTDDCNGTLQTFGFMSNKPITVKRKGKIIGRTVLQTRDQAERERLLTERIAEVLMSDDTVTQALCQEVSNNEKCKERVIVKSQRLRKIQQVEQRLWDKTRLSPKQTSFYLKSLSPYVTKPANKLSKSNSVSDNRNMIKSPINEHCASGSHDIVETPTKTVMFPIDEHDIDSPAHKDPNTSVNETTGSINEHNFITSLISDWSKTLNNSAMSDIVIFVEEKKHIWTHRLVFSVRCPNVLLDVVSNNDTSTLSAKEMIQWPNIPYLGALAFLEFIYCGTIKVNSQVFRDENASHHLRCLARKYKVKDVFNYLRIQPKMCELKSPGSNRGDRNVTSRSKINLARSVSEITIQEYRSLRETVDKTSEKMHNKIDATLLTADENFSMIDFENAATSKILLSECDGPRADKGISRENSVSPDLFDDTDAVHLHDTRKSNNISVSGGTPSYNIEHVVGSISNHSRLSNCEDVSPTRLKISTPVNGKRKVQTEIEGSTDSNTDHFSSPLSFNNQFDASLVNTPKSSKCDKSEVASSRKKKKQKGNLTLFIERVQKENAKSICDSDSDMEPILQVRPKWKRNPFNINKYNDSTCTPPSDNKAQEQVTKKRRHGLSKLEDEIRIDATENPELYNLKSPKISDDEIKSTDATSSSELRGKKRKPSNTFNDNKTVQSPIDVEEIDIENNHTVDTVSPLKIRRFSNGRSISDIDTDEDNISMYSKYKRKRVDNSIAKYRNLLKMDRSQNSTKRSSPTKGKSNPNNAGEVNKDYTVNNTFADNIIELSDWESDDSTTSTVILPKNNSNNRIGIGTQASREEPISFSPKGTDISNTDSVRHNINKTSLSEEKNEHNITFSATAVIDPNIYDAETDTENDSNAQKKRTNETGDISDDKIRPSNSINERLNTIYDTDRDVEENDRNSSTGSPEVFVELDDMGYNCFDKSDMDSAVNVDNTRYISEDVVKSKSFNSSLLSLPSSPEYDVRNVEEVNEQRHDASGKGNIGTNNRNRGSDSDYTECTELGSVPTSSKTNMNKSKKSLLCGKDAHAEITDKKNKIQTVTNSTPKRKNMKSNCDLFPKPEYIIIDRDVTPPPDYDSMPTPELHRNLKKYGLKLHKRKTAVKLLSYIYEQLHPLVPIDVEKDDGANKNKMCVTKTSPNKTGSNENINIEKDIDSACQLSRSLSQSSSTSNNPRGLDHVTRKNINEPEIEQGTDSDIGVATNVKEAFIRLARQNKQLYNKILTYEPLDIHELHAMIKAEGFKCKLNVLMDFLDEQCITFQLLEKGPKSSTRSKPFVSK